MKAFRIVVLAGLLSFAAASLVEAAGFTLEVGAIAYDFNALGSLQTPAPATVNTSKADFSPDPYFNGSYTMAFNDSTKLKLGLMAEDMMGTISPSFVMIVRAEPYVDVSMGAFSARVSFPLYYLGYDTTNDPAYKEIGYILDKNYKGINLSTKYEDDALKNNNFLFTNFESVAYRLSFDKGTALVFSASTEIGFVPAFWVYDVKPQVTFIWGPLQLDLRESIYFADQAKAAGDITPSTRDANYAARFFTDPKLAFNFGSIGLAGLKAYIAASLYTANSSTSGVNWYGAGSTSTDAALGSSITPGVSYATGPFYVEMAFKYSNYDDKVTDGITKKDPTFDPSLKVSYTLSF
ncbi:MAG: hypothetical protein ABSB63_04150 [Spirochaetia bacterium]|jgi:hypothetical protein